jgi:hypothetical protein
MTITKQIRDIIEPVFEAHKDSTFPVFRRAVIYARNRSTLKPLIHDGGVWHATWTKEWTRAITMHAAHRFAKETTDYMYDRLRSAMEKYNDK